MASTYLTRTFTSGNRKTFTISVWFKLGNPSISNSDYEAIIAASGGDHGIWIRGDRNELDLYFTQNLVGTTSIRDVNGWYHLVVGVDTTQSTESNRVKAYLNGEQFTSFDDGGGGSVTYPTLNADTLFNNNGGTCTIGKRASTNVHYWTGSMSHFHFCDGTQYAASDFGSTDSTTGEWEINVAPNVTYGTNGFFILKDNNSGTDQSGEGNNFTVGGGTLTKTEDCPDNVFATLNPLQQNNTATTYSNGNTKGTGTSSTSNFSSTPATLGASSGKFYAEYKPNLSTTDSSISGFVNLDTANFNVTDFYGGSNNMSAGIYDNGGQILHSTGTNLGSVGALSNGDIVMLAMDLDNGYLYWGKNGNWFNSANPATSGGTGGLALSNLGSNGTYTFLNSNRKSMGTEWNFGNGYFGTTAISSEGTNASGIGKFEYDVPTGYTALSTKGLNE